MTPEYKVSYKQVAAKSIKVEASADTNTPENRVELWRDFDIFSIC